MKILFPWDTSGSDSGKIDRFFPSSVQSFYIKTPLLTESIEKADLIVKIDSANGCKSEVQKQEEISFYYVKNADKTKPFIFGIDQYNFKNHLNITWKEMLDILWCDGPKIAIYSKMAAYNGQCYGMAASSGRYFLHPEEKDKIAEGNVFSWDSTNSNVREAIAKTHILQASGNNSSDYSSNQGDEFINLKRNLKNFIPMMLSMKSEKIDSLKNHVDLVTNLTILHHSDKSFIGLYENVEPNIFGIAEFNLSTNTIDYRGYDRFYVDNIPDEPMEICEQIFTSFYDDLTNSLLNDNEKIFSTACPVYLLLEDNTGKRSGYLSNGTLINEVENTEITRIATGDAAGDSITYITVPDDREYKITINGYKAGKMLFEYYATGEDNSLNISIADSIVISENFIAAFDEATSTSSLNIDYNGDGEIDSTIQMVEQVVSIEDQVYNKLPKDYSLYQNYPNPFNPTTSIKFKLPISSNVKIVVYNMLGQEVHTITDKKKSAGYHSVNFDGSALPSGLYFYKISAGRFHQVKKMLLIK